ncbi:hypothetical protein N1031_19745 [Herbiconiux moechotypicola]|nr:hypothetical protein [Herbiconiux moechotypicola]MCS5731995.1 hypothetical protein [Herbiconiux moechotypicola]
MTKEDVFNSWLRKFLADKSTNPTGFPPRVVIHICERCNNELSRVFDTPASKVLKHMMNRTPGVLTREEQLVVARWRVKTDLLYNLLRTETFYIEGPEPKTDESYERDRAMVMRMLDSEGSDLPEASVRVGIVDPLNTTTPPKLLAPNWPKEWNSHVLSSVEPLGILLFESVIFFPGQRVAFTKDNPPRDDFPYLAPTVKESIRWPCQDLPAGTTQSLRQKEWKHSPFNIVGKHDVSVMYSPVSKTLISPFSTPAREEQ